jgi:hypothetical protein
MKRIFALLFAFLLLWGWTGGEAWAYSYGKPDEEPVAEAYKRAAAALAKQPPDFAVAKKELGNVRKEMEQHAEIGPDLAAAISENLEKGRADEALFYWRQALVRNIERRLNNVEKDFDNYSANKVLLAKANSTFEILALNLEQKDPALVKKLRAEFQNALTALGNPGLFGVGKKDPDPALFKKASQTIRQELENVYIPKDEKVASGGTGHVKGKGSSGVEAASDNPMTKWIPLIVIVLTIAGALIVFRMLGRKRA